MHGRNILALCAALLTCAAHAQTAQLPRSEQLKAFKAAGFGEEASECELEETGTYRPPTMEQMRDINGDGRPDALVTESSAFCYGNARTGFSLVSQQADGQWRELASGAGNVEFLPGTSEDGWPDIQVAGPGLCIPVLRYDGQVYRLHRQVGDGCPEAKLE